MMKKLMRKIHRGQRGITGLETAIILIAFVVVASVFAYTVLSAGIFSSQKGQEAIYSGLQQTRSTLELKGGVIAKDTDSNGYIDQITFTVANALGGEPIDFTEPTAAGTDTGLAAANSNNVVVISYIDKDQRAEDLYWSITKLGNCDSDDLLEDDEKFQITIGGASAGSGPGNLEDALSTDLGTNRTFTIEVKTPNGATLNIERTTPAYIDTVLNLD